MTKFTTRLSATGRSLPALLVLLTLISCARQQPPAEPFPSLLTADAEWITYDGILRNANGQDVLVELHLMPAAPGIDSWYTIRESLIDPRHPNRPLMEATSRGTYSVLFGSPGENVIRINDRALVGSVMRGKSYGSRDQVTEHLVLKSNGDHELILANENLRPSDPRYKLVRRSDLFTVEGYFTAYPDTAEYYEKNTQKRWGVARFGEYDDAVKGYHSLAKEKHEGVYLKALSYSIRHQNAEGREIDALVFKRILNMDTTRSIQ